MGQVIALGLALIGCGISAVVIANATSETSEAVITAAWIGAGVSIAVAVVTLAELISR